VEVKVKDNNVMQAFRKLKKKLHNEDVIQDIKDRKFYIKPSEKRRLKRKDAIQRSHKEQSQRRLMD